MLQQNHSAETQSNREIVITRVFNAPRELVFKAWTEPKHIEQRDGHLQSGMKIGLRETLNRLAELLASMA